MPTGSAEAGIDMPWTPQEEDFVILLEEGGWNLGSVQQYNPVNDSVCVQLLTSLKTRAKDNRGKTYWIYPDEDTVDDFQQKNLLHVRPSVIVAKNIKRKDLVLALLNWEVIEGICEKLYAKHYATPLWYWQRDALEITL